MTNKTLVIYYSHSNGNTKRIAGMVQKALHADIAELEVVTPYTGTYDEVVAQGQREVESKFQPALKPLDVPFDQYDTIAIGTPTWWYTMAPAVLSFLSSHSWEGKTVMPFMTHAGWPGHVIKDMKKVCVGATFQHDKQIRFDADGGDQMVTPEAELQQWLASLGD